MASPPIENAVNMAEEWEAYGGETTWSRAARRFGELGGLVQYWCGMPRSASAIPLTFALFKPDGTPLPSHYRLKDIHAAIATLEAERVQP
jgi:hypothetical protein